MCSNMHWMDHINLVPNKIRKMFYLFRELRNIWDRRKLRTVYKAITKLLYRTESYAYDHVLTFYK